MLKRSTDGKQRVLSLSYGKDSMACLGACELLGWSLDRIVTADVWATDEIEADLPPMVEFKAKADKIILERYGIQVEHFCATFPPDENGVRKRATYEKSFYLHYSRHKTLIEGKEDIYGFPFQKCPWCNSRLKMSALSSAKKSSSGSIQYIGIAADEPNRFHNLTDKVLSPLVEIGWDERTCFEWCKQQGLLSPIYESSARGGCWFCHNQGIGQLRILRKTYPQLWQLLLKWDNDSPTPFHPDGRTAHDFEERFKLEDEGFIYPEERWNWSKLNEELNYRWF